MPNIRIVKLKVRRGSEAERKLVVLEQGELGYTVDTRRLFIGNGFISGGEVVASKVHDIQPTSDTRNLVSTAYQNDIVYENNFLYQLTGTDYSKLSAWGFIGSQVDNESIEYDGNRKLRLKSSGISSAMVQLTSITVDKLNSNTVFASGGLTLNPANGLSANIDTSVFKIENNTIKLRLDTGVTSVNSSILSKGLTGGSGVPLSAAIDNETIVFNTANQLTLGTINGTNINLGQGMSIDNNDALVHIIRRVDEDFNVTGGQLQLQEKLAYNNTEYVSPNIIVDKTGLIRAVNNNYCLPLSANHSQFGGFASQLSGFENRLTTVSASTGIGAAAFTLSSAGFMVTRIGTPNITTGDTRNFLNSQYVAIPIFTIPQSVINLAANVVTLLYPYTYFGYRAYDPSGTYTGELCSAVLTAAACSGDQDWFGYAVEYDIYSADSSLKIGSRFAVATNALTTFETPTLSGWWAIGTTLYFVNSTNTVTITGNC